MFSAIGEILSRIAMQVTIDRLKVAVQTSRIVLNNQPRAILISYNNHRSGETNDHHVTLTSCIKIH